jgi:teichuronic acid exporter
MLQSSSQKLFAGIFWSAIEVLIKRVLDLAIKLVLARMLFPEDFGVIGMATVLTSLIQVLNDAGMGSALIQRKKDELREEHFHTVFWTGVAWSIILYLLVSFIIGPMAATFYNTPVLKSIIPVLSLSILSSSVNVVHKAQLMRDLKFKKIALINNLGSVFSGTLSIILAFAGFGVWALVFNAVASFVIMMPMFFIATGWKPLFMWEKEAFRDIFGFGAYTTGTLVINNISSNMDYLIIGKLLSAAVLGTYTLAYMLTKLVNAQVASMLNRVMFPFYSSIQSDIDKVKQHYIDIIKYYSILIYPIMLTLIIFGEPIVFYCFGSKWNETIPPMKILAFSVLVDAMSSGDGLLFRSIGKAKLEMQVQTFVSLFIYIPSIVIGTYLNGAVGAAFGILGASLIKLLIAQLLLKKFFNIAFIDLFRALKPSIIAFSGTFLIISTLLIYVHINFFFLLILLLFVYFLIAGLFIKNDLVKILIKFKNK